MAAAEVWVMVIYDLSCSSGHLFEGWFRSAADYAEQVRDGHLACPVCQSDAIRRLPNASRLNCGTQAPDKPQAAHGDAATSARQEMLIGAVHRFVETHFEYVGSDFANEARRIHNGAAEERGIRGLATREEVRELTAEGIRTLPMPLPASERKKLN